MAGNVFIEDLRKRLEQARQAGKASPSTPAAGNFLVQSKQTPINKNGKPYVALVLSDRTGSVEARIWDNLEQLPAFEAGDYLEVKAEALSYQGRMQLKVHSVRPLPAGRVDPDEFLPASPRDRGLMLARLQELLGSLADAPLREMLLEPLGQPDFRARLSRAPAAKSIHHAYVGGLLEHTLNLMELADRLAALQPDLQRDLLLAGAYVHDLGKLEELDPNRGFEYTDPGRLVGHLVLGAMLLGEWARAHPGLAPETLMKLQHIVLSHHGEKEFGSPVVPLFTEALVVHQLDLLDSKVQAFREVAARERGQRWSSYQRQLDRYLLLDSGAEVGAPEAAEAPEAPRAAKADAAAPLTQKLPLAPRAEPQELPLGEGRERGRRE